MSGSDAGCRCFATVTAGATNNNTAAFTVQWGEDAGSGIIRHPAWCRLPLTACKPIPPHQTVTVRAETTASDVVVEEGKPAIPAEASLFIA